MKFPRVIILALGLAVTANAQRISELPETNYLADVDSLYWLSKEDTGYASRRVLWGLLRSNVNTGLSLTNMPETVETRNAQILRFWGGQRLTLLSLDETDDSGTGIWFSDDGVPYWQIRAETDSQPLEIRNVGSNAVFSVTQTSNIIVHAGSLGIGTNDPQSRIDIVDLSANSSPGIRIGNDAQAWTMRTYGAEFDQWELLDVVNSKVPFKVYPNSGNNTLVCSNTMVGIGTASPSTYLDIIPLGNSAGMRIATANATIDPAFQMTVISSTDWKCGIDNSDGDKFKISNSSTLGSADAITLVPTSLRCGLATTNPVALLHVNGDIAITGTYIAAGTTGNTNTAKVAGSVNFAVAAQTLYVTNAHATNGVLAFATLNTADATATSCAAIPANPAAGVLALILNAAATAETRVSFLIIKP
jgi:hypothetical protein